MQPINKATDEPTKASILTLLNAGNVSEAKKDAEKLVQVKPDDCEVQYLFGLVLLMDDDFEEAIVWLNKAVIQRPDDAVFVSNLGVAYLRSDSLDKAIEYLDSAVQLNPDYELARYNLGSAYIENEQASQAIIQFRYLTVKHADNADYFCALADAIRESGKWKESVKHYKKALKLDDSLARAHNNMGSLMRHIQNMDAAFEHCKRAIELDPENVKSRRNLGDCYIQIEELEEAMEAFADAYEIDSENAELCVAIGNVWLEISDQKEASSWYQKALNIDSDNIKAKCGLANIIRETGNLAGALERLKPLLESDPDDIDVLISMADTLWEDGDAESALEHLTKVKQLQPQRTAMHAKMGQILSSSGNIDKALDEYHIALEQSPNCIPALSGLASTLKGKLDITHVEKIESLLNNDKLRDGALASLHSALAFYYDSKKDYSIAAKHMNNANAFQWKHRAKRGWEYEINKQEKHISQLIETYTPAYFDKVRDLGNTDETPVFIVAMPRSGTTLTEQILARHEKVLGIGERNFASQAFNQYICRGTEESDEDFTHLHTITKEEIASISKRYLFNLQDLKDKADKPDVLRVVDKMPDNYSLVGWILTLFPNAKIIHAKRDPRDVALSCWLTQFGSIRWACHEEHIVQRIKQYERIMEHWHKVIPDRFIEMNYEDLVVNQEEESKRLIKYIGLDWDKNCLRFFESDRIVRTASITQVRQPIYNKSVARWKPYQALIPELINPLMSLD